MGWEKEYGIRLEAFQRESGESHGSVYRQLGALGLLRSGMSLLSIGAGRGHLEIDVARQHDATISYLDPSPNLLQAFEEESARKGITKQIDEKFLGTFQAFETQRAYDLILSVHSWSYIGRDRQGLEKALALLAPGGHLCIALGSERGDLEQLRDIVRPEDEEAVRVEDMSKWAADIGHSNRIEILESPMAATRFVDSRGFTDYGKAWIAYMARCNWQDLPADLIQRARDLIEAKQSDGGLSYAWGTLLFPKT
jgi:SAM-dependent methyltransferase